MAVPPSFGTQPPVPDAVPGAVPASSSSPALGPAHHNPQNDQGHHPDDQDATGAPSSPTNSPAPALVDYARRVATEHHQRHGRPITRDALRARLGVSNALASELLRHVRTEPPDR
jgi:hypothetical protein